MINKDYNYDYWNEKFISVLSTLFAEQVRIKTKVRFEEKILIIN